jgi:iron complex transport system ATP-binding protein
METLLHTGQLSIGYRNGRRQASPIVEHITVALRAGELTCLIGPNGVGKSTLLRTLAGMQPPLAGHVDLGGDDLHRLSAGALARRLAVVLTERIDVGNLSAYALVGLGRHPYTDWQGRLQAHDEEVVRQTLTRVGAAHLAARPVAELSDGERQRVMIARALAQEPQVLILDEPTAFLDLPGRVEMMHLLAALARQTRCAILLSTHDLELALRVADKLWLLPPGGPVYTGLPEELALNGVLGQVFRSEGVVFDPATGAFKLQRHPCGPIALHGEGVIAQWTARALERIGYEIAPNDTALPLRVEVNGAGWHVVTPHEHRHYNSLAELIERVKHG